MLDFDHALAGQRERSDPARVVHQLTARRAATRASSCLAPELAPNISIHASIKRDGKGGAYSETLINRDISLLAVTARDA
jgi:hypothetical protein